MKETFIIRLPNRPGVFMKVCDLIARDGDTLAFIEVKARPDARLGSGVEAVTADKRRRVRNAARAYCLRKGCADAVCRFDILEFSRAGVQYLKNAF